MSWGNWPNENKIPEYLELPEDHPLVIKIRKIDALIKELNLDLKFRGDVEDIDTEYHANVRYSWNDKIIRCFILNEEFGIAKNKWYDEQDAERERKAKEDRERKIQEEKDRVARNEQNKIDYEKRLLVELKAKYEHAAKPVPS